MPTPERTTLPAIVSAARTILEAEGPAGLTMNSVAARVGVKAPSLYKRVHSRDRLIELVVEATLADLHSHLAAIEENTDPRERLIALAWALRRFARQNPAAYRLIFASGPEVVRIDLDLLEQTSAPLLEAVQELSREEGTQAGWLADARLVTAWTHGFISMELAGAFRLGGEVDEAFAHGIDRIAGAIATPSAP